MCVCVTLPKAEKQKQGLKALPAKCPQPPSFPPWQRPCSLPPPPATAPVETNTGGAGRADGRLETTTLLTTHLQHLDPPLPEAFHDELALETINGWFELAGVLKIEVGDVVDTMSDCKNCHLRIQFTTMEKAQLIYQALRSIGWDIS